MAFDTTTTSLVAALLDAAGMDPTVINGGIINNYGTNARLGAGDWIVVEADESDGTFVNQPATIAVVTNMDAEHLDHYGTLDNIKRAFVDFINRIPFFGLAVLCSDNAVVQSIVPEVQKRFVTYGIGNQAQYRARNIRYEGLQTRYVAWRGAEELGEVTLSMPGAHNVLNSLAVLAVCEHVKVPFAAAAQALSSFEGIQRRFTVRGEVGGITIVDDFGHHPAEVKATLSGAREGFPGRRIVAAFQPHRYTRTRDQFEAFATAFADADTLVMCDVFAAGEEPIAGASSAALVKAIEKAGHRQVKYIAQREDVAPYLAQLCDKGDMVITLGAGDIQLTCNELIELLESRGERAVIKNLARR